MKMNPDIKKLQRKIADYAHNAHSMEYVNLYDKLTEKTGPLSVDLYKEPKTPKEASANLKRSMMNTAKAVYLTIYDFLAKPLTVIQMFILITRGLIIPLCSKIFKLHIPKDISSLIIDDVLTEIEKEIVTMIKEDKIWVNEVSADHIKEITDRTITKYLYQ